MELKIIKISKQELSTLSIFNAVIINDTLENCCDSCSEEQM